MRILEVADVSPLKVIGGGERVLWEQAWRLAARGHRVSIVGRAPGAAAGEVSVDGIRVREFAVDRRSLPRFVASSILQARRWVVREIERGGADVLHLHQPLSAFAALASAAGRRLPSLYTFHSPAPLEYLSRRGMTPLHRGGLTGRLAALVLRGLERACVRRAGRLHVLSGYSGDLLRDLYGVPARRLVVIPGGVDTAAFVPSADRAATRRALGLPEGRPLLLTIRNLEARMGLDELLRAFAQLSAQVPGALLVIGGAGSLRAPLEAMAAALEVDRHVRFLGWVADRDLPRYYQAADAFVLPSRALEGFGLVTVEALACGTPVLGTPVGATPEILTPLAPSLVFRDASAAAMAAGLGEFFERARRDPAGQRALREACRRHAERYGWERSVEGLETTLAGLAAEAA